MEGQHNHYARINGAFERLGNVDDAVERRLPQRRLRRSLRECSGALLLVLGEHSGVWLRLEQLLACFRVEREAAYFNIGYEHGLCAGRVELSNATAASSDVVRPGEDVLAQRVYDAVMLGEASNATRVAALLDAARTLVLRVD